MVVTPQSAGLLQEVRRGIYSLSMGDASALLAEMNAAYGLARMRWALRSRAVDDSGVVCVFGPDGGITRNKERWAAGFGYGCLIRWPDAAEAGRVFAFPQIKPNACGTFVAKLSSVPRVERLWERLEAAKGTEFTLSGSRLKLNLGVSNHFIEVCRVTTSTLAGLRDGDTIAVLHTSPSELKDELYDFARWERQGGVWDQTPFGPIFVLEGEPAEAYHRTYQEIDGFSSRKRAYLAQVMFGEHQEISNHTHQGLSGQNVASLGVYRTSRAAVGGAKPGDEGARPNGDGAWSEATEPVPNGDPVLNGESATALVFPLTLRADLPVYLMRGRPNLSPRVLAAEGLAARAGDAGHAGILAGADILPHGAGYKLLVSPDRITLSEQGVKRYFRLTDSRSELVVSDPRELPYDYRGSEVLKRIEDLQLGEVAATAEQIYTLKY